MYGYLGNQEVIYVVQEEPPMTQEEADKFSLYASILGGYFSNKGKSASQLQADIDYLKKKRQQFPIIKDFLTRQIQKKRELKKVLEEQALQESLRDKGKTYIVFGGVAVLLALTYMFVKKGSSKK